MGLSKETLEKLTDRSTDIVVATDRKGTVVYYNDGATRSLGYAPDEILGSFVGHLYSSVEEAKRVMEVMRGPEHGGPGIADAIQTVLAKNVLYSYTHVTKLLGAAAEQFFTAAGISR